MTKLSKLDTALDVIANVFFDAVPVEIKDKTSGAVKDQTVTNRMSWAQRDIIQSIAWKCNSALDRANGADARMNTLRTEAQAMTNSPEGEIDMVAASRLANQVEFWSLQQGSLESLMSAASDCLVRHGHEAYTRTDMSKSRSAPINTKSEKEINTIFAALGVTQPERGA